MSDIKSFLESRTVWAAIVGFLAVIANAFGLNLGFENAEAVDAIMKVVEGVSFMAAIFFRIKATAKIG